MATPPPLPPRSSGPPPLPPRRTGITDPNATNAQFDQRRGGISSRDVQRSSGKMFGVWIAVASTNVNRVKVDQDVDKDGNRLATGTIYIEFLDLSQYMFPNRPMGDFMDIIESQSKGRKVYYDVRGPGKSRPGMSKWQPCIKIRGPQRKVTAEMRKAREPVGRRQEARKFTRGGERNAFGKGGARIVS